MENQNTASSDSKSSGTDTSLQSEKNISNSDSARETLTLKGIANSLKENTVSEEGTTDSRNEETDKPCGQMSVEKKVETRLENDFGCGQMSVEKEVEMKPENGYESGSFLTDIPNSTENTDVPKSTDLTDIPNSTNFTDTGNTDETDMKILERESIKNTFQESSKNVNETNIEGTSAMVGTDIEMTCLDSSNTSLAVNESEQEKYQRDESLCDTEKREIVHGGMKLKDSVLKDQSHDQATNEDRQSQDSHKNQDIQSQDSVGNQMDQSLDQATNLDSQSQDNRAIQNDQLLDQATNQDSYSQDSCTNQIDQSQADIKWEWKNNKDNYEYFWKSYSPFSQWYYATFEVDGFKYNCAEKFMMHRKAVLMGDEKIAEKILNTNEPRIQKSLGRKVKNFDQKLWDENCMAIVEEGNEAKFSQNIDLKNILFATYPKTLVEASPIDKIWGIGLVADDPLAWDESTWNGKNLLGYALTRVRDKMMKKDGIIP